MPSINLHPLDYVVIGIYLLITFAIGFIAERWARRGADDYFLGGRKLPWWALGASGMASNVDISGTALAVGLIYALGVTGFFIEIRGGIVLVMAILLAFMGKWNRRSGVMTRAEWMIFRFGDGLGGKLARVASAFAEILFAIWVVGFFAKGLEIFVGPLVPFNASITAVAIVLFVMIYSMAGGLTGVVWTDVFQGGLILLAVLYVCALGIAAPPLPETFNVSVPMGDGQFQQIGAQASSWLSPIPPAQMDIPGSYGDYNAFTLLIGIYLLRTVIEGMSGSGGYMIQRYLAAKSERDAGLISAFWIFLLMFRWPMVVSFAVLGIHYGIDQGAPIANPEAVLPTMIEVLLPIGIKGLLVACFLAAFMSTLSSFLNGSAAYWVQDIYKPFLRPGRSTPSQEVWQGRLATLVFVALGLLTAYFVSDLNTVWDFLQLALAGGIIVPMLLRWYWWRFNGEGFAIGTVCGNAMALAIWFGVADELGSLQKFLLTGGVALVGSVAGTYLTQPTPPDVLDNFYRVTRPFGLWGHQRRRLPAEQIALIKRENRFELASMIVAVPWQLLLFLVPMLLILKQWGTALPLLLVLTALTLVLYFVWYRQLSPREDREKLGTAKTGELAAGEES